MSQARKQAYLVEIALGQGRCRAARNIGIDRTTIFRHMNKDRDFALAVERAEVQAVAKKEEMVRAKKEQRCRERTRKVELQRRLGMFRRHARPCD